MTKTVDHKAFFPILAQSAGDGRGQAFKADANAETASDIVAALVASLAALSGTKPAAILDAAYDSPALKSAKSVTRGTRAANAKPAAKTAKAERSVNSAKPAAKTLKLVEGAKVMARDTARDNLFYRATVVKAAANGLRAKVEFANGETATVKVSDLKARRQRA